MAWQGRRLCDPRLGRRVGCVGFRLLLECGRAAALRNRAAARRPRVSRSLRSLLIAAGPGEWRAAWVEVVADDPAIVRELRDAFPAAAVAHRRAEDWPIDLDALFEMALSPSLVLSGGGIIHIAEARAAMLIDVDTGTPEAGSAERAALTV